MNATARELAIELILGGMNVQQALSLAALSSSSSESDSGIQYLVAPSWPIAKMPSAACVQAYLAGKQPISRSDIEEAFSHCGAD